MWIAGFNVCLVVTAFNMRICKAQQIWRQAFELSDHAAVCIDGIEAGERGLEVTKKLFGSMVENQPGHEKTLYLKVQRQEVRQEHASIALHEAHNARNDPERQPLAIVVLTCIDDRQGGRVRM